MNSTPSTTRRRLLWIAIVLAAAFAAPAAAADITPAGPLMRFPDIHGGTVAFAHAEDIWIVPAAGGTARRITIHEGEERFPKISPDGKAIAFTAEYDGNPDVYVMSLDGGGITRLTWHPGADEVVGWHPLKNKVLFRSARHSWDNFYHLFLIHPDGSGLEELPIHEAAWGSFSPDGQQIAYTRVATEDRTWKRYRGGLAPEIHIYDFQTGQDRKVTDFPGTDRFPIWIGQEIYFQSDRDGTLNLWALDPATGKARQATTHRDYDAGRPSGLGPEIAYELGGTLRVLNTANGQSRTVPVEIRSDDPETRPYFKNASDAVTGMGLSPAAERAVLVARGEVFTVPAKDGPVRNLSGTPGAREKDAAWSPDGTRIAWFSDLDGEWNLYLSDPLAKTPPAKLTAFKDGYRHGLSWSPDGKKIAFADQLLTLYFIDVETRQITPVDKAGYEPMDIALDEKPIHDFAWSPDSAFLAYSKMGRELTSQLFVYSLETRQAGPVTDGFFNDFGPVFSADGERLFFVSNRRFDPTYCDMEFELVYKKVSGLYSLALRKGAAPLLPLRSDEAAVKTGEAPAKPAGDAKADATRTVVDFDGIFARVEALPLPRGNYRSLSATGKALYFLNADEGDFNRFDLRERGPATLCAFDFAGRKKRTVMEEVSAYRLCRDGSKLIYAKGSEFGLAEAGADKAKGEALKLSDLTLQVDPPAEWRQIYNEAWRMERDFYYDPNVHGLDWPAMREKYGRLLPFASCRGDVRFLIGELISELNTSHTYVSGGDRRRKADRVKVGLLGVDWTADAASGRYRFGRILRAPDWTVDLQPPLAGLGVDIQAGDYLLAVNGREVTTASEVYRWFEGLADKQVSLTVNRQPGPDGAREVAVKPASEEMRLRYLDWVERNRQAVDKASGGKIGYIHLPDTYTGSARMFPTYYYGQTQKEGLLIDGRFNHGGLDPDVFLERLDKEVLFYWTRRHSHDYTTPLVVTRAHLAMLTNRQAGSGGDMLPAEFQLRQMGPVIGTRTWGGLVGISTFIPLLDGGMVTAPDYRVYTPDGKWVIENDGVHPDIELDLDPAEMARGHDAQLLKGIGYLMEKIKAEPRTAPPRPPAWVDPDFGKK
jgi:tricorn protease